MFYIGLVWFGTELYSPTLLRFRRTIKDTITFIPVVIILLIPLSPIGHVLVFGAIQRVFPDFFPSCFTERRQNLLGKCTSVFPHRLSFFSTLDMTRSCSNKSSQIPGVVCSELYESTEYSAVTINETWSQQLIRISQAIGFSTAQMGKQLFGFSEDTEKDTDENDPKQLR